MSPPFQLLGERLRKRAVNVAKLALLFQGDARPATLATRFGGAGGERLQMSPSGVGNLTSPGVLGQPAPPA